VADKDGRLLGVATDGDTRRWIIAGKGLEEPISGAMNPSPFTVRPGWDRSDLESTMAENHFEAVPVVDERGSIVDVVFWHDLFEQRKLKEPLNLPVVIMAGGLGSRLAPFTNVLPKPVVPVGDKPITQLIMDRFAGWGCDRFFLLLNHKANLIRAFFDDVDEPWSITSVVEDRPLGTAGALSLIRSELIGTFFLTNCDILIDADYASILQFHRDSRNEVTLVASQKHFAVPYGVCEVGDGGRLISIAEKPAFDFLVSTGFYVLEPSALDAVPTGELFHMTDLMNTLIDAERAVGVYPVSEGSWLDMGALDELQNMLERLGVNKP
jgi:NDP-sugar pyrophosphorylase family protein